MNPTLMLWNQLRSQYIRAYDKRVDFCRCNAIDIYSDNELLWIRKKIDFVSDHIVELQKSEQESFIC